MKSLGPFPSTWPSFFLLLITSQGFVHQPVLSNQTVKGRMKRRSCKGPGQDDLNAQWATNFPLPTPTSGCPVHTQSWAAFCEIGRSFLRAPSLSIRQKHLWLQVWIGMLSVSWQPERAWIPSHVLKLYKSSTNCTDAEEITNNAL